MRIVFAGTPDFAARHLQALITSEHQIVAVYTQPDRPAGRGKKLQASAVKELAQTHGLRVEQPLSLKDSETQRQLQSYQADMMVVVAYGLILPRAVLNIPPLGCINVHGSLLPRWRGAAPIQRAIWAGDSETGVTIMQMDEGLDTGPMLLTESIEICALDTSASLYEKLAELGPPALLTALQKIESEGLPAEPQPDEGVTYARKLAKDEARIDWQQSAAFIERCVRAFNPWPGTEFVLQEQRFKVWEAELAAGDEAKVPGTILEASKEGLVVQTGEGALRILRLQPPGKKAMHFSDVINARASLFTPGTVISNHE